MWQARYISREPSSWQNLDIKCGNITILILAQVLFQNEKGTEYQSIKDSKFLILRFFFFFKYVF